jgi:hypothetical protein
MQFTKLFGPLTALLLFAGMSVAATPALYDESADAHQQVTAALAEAARSGKNVVLLFGANW